MSRRQDREKKKREAKKRAAKRERAVYVRSLETLATLGEHADCLDWPVTLCVVPLADCWDATGLGCAAIERRQPDGRVSGAFFWLDLERDGVEQLFAVPDRDSGEMQAILTHMGDNVPPFTEGTVDVLSRYVWGAVAWSIDAGCQWERGKLESALSLVPKPAGTPGDWIDGLVGKHGLVSPRLLEIIDRGPLPEELPPGKGNVVLTDATFATESPAELVERLRGQGSPFKFVREKDGRAEFSLSHETVLKNGRRLNPDMGTLTVYRDAQPRVVASSVTLSKAARLIAALKKVAGDAVSLAETDWRDAVELDRRGEDLPDRNDLVPLR